MKRLCVYMFALLLTILMAIPALAAEKVYRLTFAGHAFDRSDIMAEAIIPWIKSLNERSNGRLQITFYNPGTICAELEILDSIETGRVSMGSQNVNRNPGKLPYSSAYVKGMIGSFNSTGSTTGLYNLYKDHPEFLDDYTKFNKFKLLFIFSTSPSAVFANKNLATVGDLKNMRILSPGVDGVSQANSVGARGIQMPPSDFYMALQRGMAEGAIYTLTGLKSLKLEEVSTDIARVGLSGGVVAVVMNQVIFDSLPKDLQQLIDEASGFDMALKVSNFYDEIDQRMLKSIQGKNIKYTTFSAEERNKFADMCKEGYIQLNIDTFKSRNLDGEAIFNVAHEYCVAANLEAEKAGMTGAK